MLCKNCEKNEAIKYSKYSNGNFCSKQCSRAFSTKEKRGEINVKVKKKLTGLKRGEEFGEKVSINNLKRNDQIKKQIGKSVKKFYDSPEGKEVKNKLSLLGKKKIFSAETRKKISEKVLEKCKDINERIRLREIGRKGGFGKKGFTKGGIRYESSFEQKCFEYLEENNILFEPHKLLPNSSKICDIYLENKKLWIELDGINREKKKKYLGKDYEYWLEKLEQYKNKKLNYIIFYTYKEFIDFMRL